MSGSPWYLLGVGEYIFEYDIYTICQVHRGVFLNDVLCLWQQAAFGNLQTSGLYFLHPSHLNLPGAAWQ